MSWELKTSFILGVLHSLEPGHGKTAMLAMLLDRRKKWFDALCLALSAVLSHSALMFIIALLTHFGSHLILGHNLEYFFSEHLRILGPFLLIVIGLSLFMKSQKKNKKCCNNHSHENNESSRVPILLGISIGLYPCPTLIATYVSSVTHGKFALGVAAVGIFTLGSFFSILLTAFGMKLIGQKIVKKISLNSTRFNWNKAQGLAIIGIGLVSLLHS